jgi:hypothetical protein
VGTQLRHPKMAKVFRYLSGMEPAYDTAFDRTRMGGGSPLRSLHEQIGVRSLSGNLRSLPEPTQQLGGGLSLSPRARRGDALNGVGWTSFLGLVQASLGGCPSWLCRSCSQREADRMKGAAYIPQLLFEGGLLARSPFAFYQYSELPESLLCIFLGHSMRIMHLHI